MIELSAELRWTALWWARYGVLCLGALAFLPGPAKAETLFGLISERNSASVAQAAAQHVERYPKHKLVFRTPRQLAAFSDAAIQAQLTTADTVLVAGVFSEDAARIGRLIDALPASTPFFAVRSASTLGEQSKVGLQGRP